MLIIISSGSSSSLLSSVSVASVVVSIIISSVICLLILWLGNTWHSSIILSKCWCARLRQTLLIWGCDYGVTNYEFKKITLISENKLEVHSSGKICIWTCNAVFFSETIIGDCLLKYPYEPYRIAMSRLVLQERLLVAITWLCEVQLIHWSACLRMSFCDIPWRHLQLSDLTTYTRACAKTWVPLPTTRFIVSPSWMKALLPPTLPVKYWIIIIISSSSSM